MKKDKKVPCADWTCDQGTFKNSATAIKSSKVLDWSQLRRPIWVGNSKDWLCKSWKLCCNESFEVLVPLRISSAASPQIAPCPVGEKTNPGAWLEMIHHILNKYNNISQQKSYPIYLILSLYCPSISSILSLDSLHCLQTKRASKVRFALPNSHPSIVYLHPPNTLKNWKKKHYTSWIKYQVYEVGTWRGLGIIMASWHHPGIGIPPFGIQGAAFQSTQNLTRVDLGPPASTHAVPLGAPFGTSAAAAAVGALDGDRVLCAAAPHGLHTRPEGGVLGLQDFSLGRDDDFGQFGL
jgi:hypothetical protein